MSDENTRLHVLKFIPKFNFEYMWSNRSRDNNNYTIQPTNHNTNENSAHFRCRIKEMAHKAKYELLASTAQLCSMVRNDKLWEG